MRIAILDPTAGISGDMLLGALIAVGGRQDVLESLPSRVGFPGAAVQVRRVVRAGISAIKVDFDIPPQAGGHGHHVQDLVRRVQEADVTPQVRERAVRAFRLIGEAEGRVHGVEPGRVHLHEVGAVDAVLDIVGACELMEHLGVGAVYNLPVALGNGWVEAAHGTLPVPAPATALLLEGTDVTAGDGPVQGEATTPTGAALLRVLSAGPPPTRWRATAHGWGAGTRDPAGYPNALRLVLAEAAVEAAEVEVIVSDLDDMTPEYMEPLREAVFAAGALDCSVWPTQGKKGRVSLRVEALSAPEHADGVLQALFQHSTTGGARRWRAQRVTLARRDITVELAPEVPVRVKVMDAPGGKRYKAEYQDVVAAAARMGVPAFELARQVERRARAALEGAAERDSLSTGSDDA